MKNAAQEQEGPKDYVIRVHEGMRTIAADHWNRLLSRQATPTPFMRHEYLAGLELSNSVTPAAGWTPMHLTLHRTGSDADFIAGCPLYSKAHSWGEYVFDWAWADAYERHGLNYYPKLLVAVPFAPVPGTRLIAEDANARNRLLAALTTLAREGHRGQTFSSLHLLFGDAADQQACQKANLLERRGVQFHWRNQHPGQTRSYDSFDDFLGALNHDKRKKIRQERRKVADAGIRFRHARGTDISPQDWDFFHRCYTQTYREHGHAPYLSRAFFDHLEHTQASNWVLFVAERHRQPIASSLIAINEDPAIAVPRETEKPGGLTAYGRYWGAIERVDCLHFECCYYQPLQWCIDHGIQTFEGGAQGEHKMARALMPVATASAHWLAHPAFASAVGQFLQRESAGIAGYLVDRREHSPFKQGPDIHPGG